MRLSVAMEPMFIYFVAARYVLQRVLSVILFLYSARAAKRCSSSSFRKNFFGRCNCSDLCALRRHIIYSHFKNRLPDGDDMPTLCLKHFFFFVISLIFLVMIQKRKSKVSKSALNYLKFLHFVGKDTTNM